MTPYSNQNAVPVISRIGPCVVLNHSEPVTVLEAFSHGVYLRSSNGAVYCLCDSNLPIGPFSLHCDNWSDLEKALPTPLRPGMVLGNDGDNLHFSSRLKLSYASAKRWQRERPMPSSAWHVEAALERIRTMVPPQTGGLGRLIPLIFGCIPSCAPEDEQDAVLLTATSDAIARLDEWLLYGEPNDLCAAVHQLAGLGSGPLPSGDEVLRGVLFGLHAFGEGEFVAALEKCIAATVQYDTNAVSGAYLWAAARGHVSSALHDATEALCTDADDLEHRVTSLTANGRVSDLEAFLGVLLTFVALQQKFSTADLPRFQFESAVSAHPSISSIP